VSRRTRLVLTTLLAVTLVVVGVVYLPTRTWFGQQEELDRSQAELRKLEQGNAVLGRKIDRLSDASSIEEQARQQYGFRLPGEESYTVPPAKPMEVDLPAVWPFDELQDSVARAAARGR
jgi:cell division protein FtsB